MMALCQTLQGHGYETAGFTAPGEAMGRRSGSTFADSAVVYSGNDKIL